MLDFLLPCRTIPTWQSFAALGLCGLICNHWDDSLAKEVVVDGGTGWEPGSMAPGALSSEAGDP